MKVHEPILSSSAFTPPRSPKALQLQLCQVIPQVKSSLLWREAPVSWRDQQGALYWVLGAPILALPPSQLPQGLAEAVQEASYLVDTRGLPHANHPGSRTRRKAWPGGHPSQPPKMVSHAPPGSEEHLRRSLKPDITSGLLWKKKTTGNKSPKLCRHQQG